MALDKGDWSYTPGTDYVGNLMVDIGARINIRYHPLGSDTESIETEIFAQYGITCDKLFGFNEDTVKRYLSNAQPVIVSGWIPDSSGHAWIIDGYKAVTEITYSGYQWVLIPPDSLSYYPNLNYDYVLTEHQKELLYPNVQEYDMEYYDPSAPSYKVYYRMNWGANGSYDDGLYLLDFQHGWCSDSDTLNFSRYLCTIQNYHLQ